MLIKRRNFLQIGSLASASLMLPKLLKAFENPNLIKVPQGNKVLIVLQFNGGNDGLNTVVPISNDIYYKLRPKIAIDKSKALGLTDEVGLHPSLTALKELYNNGELSILNNVGYDNPDRSHFRSMDIWQTASKSNETWQTGWLGRYLDTQCANCDKPTQALELDDTLSLAMKGAKQKALALKDPKKLFAQSQEKYLKTLAAAHHHQDHEKPVDYLYKTMAETISSAEYIYKQSNIRPSLASYPNTELAKSFKTISSLVLSDVNTKVYYVSLGSFDTHVNQENTQQRLFNELNGAVDAFVKDMKANGRFEDILLMTFSEFGRRVGQNASGGTDHGTANNMFLMSGALKQKGLLNPMADLSNLIDGDLRYQVDFKSVYATVLRKWLGANDAEILGRQYDYLSFV